MKYDPQIHHRRSIRLRDYDYTQPGAYFITICTHQHDQIFGEIIDREMRLSALGEIVREEWLRSGEIRKEVKIFEDEFVVMPNHLHGIIWILESVGADAVRPTGGVHPTRRDARRASLRRVPRSVGSFIGGFKASVTARAARELYMTGIWQRNYYERIIRNDRELENIWKYIDANPTNWEADEENR